jgi:hypothetical protein
MRIFESIRPARAQVCDVRGSGEFIPDSEMTL